VSKGNGTTQKPQETNSQREWRRGVFWVGEACSQGEHKARPLVLWQVQEQEKLGLLRVWPGPIGYLTFRLVVLLIHVLKTLQQAVHLGFDLTQCPPDGVQLFSWDCWERGQGWCPQRL
jgi:hypothetical protein